MPRKNTTAAMRFAMAASYTGQLVHIEVVTDDKAAAVHVADLAHQFVLVRMMRMKDQKLGPGARGQLAELAHALRPHLMDQHVAAVALLDDRFARAGVAADHDGAVGGLEPITAAEGDDRDLVVPVGETRCDLVRIHLHSIVPRREDVLGQPADARRPVNLERLLASKLRGREHQLRIAGRVIELELRGERVREIDWIECCDAFLMRRRDPADDARTEVDQVRPAIDDDRGCRTGAARQRSGIARAEQDDLGRQRQCCNCAEHGSGASRRRAGVGSETVYGYSIARQPDVIGRGVQRIWVIWGHERQRRIARWTGRRLAKKWTGMRSTRSTCRASTTISVSASQRRRTSRI